MSTFYKSLLLSLLPLLLLISCSEEESPSTNQHQTLNEEELMDQVEKEFSFAPNQNFNALYRCARLNSVLDWYFLFYGNGRLDVLFTTDAHEDFSFRGSYEYENDEIRLLMNGGPTIPFPNGLDETSTLIMPQFGLVAAFATPQMACICVGHSYDEQTPSVTNANYDCPIINSQAATEEDNAIELVHRAVPFEFPVTGSIFRQQETYVNGLNNPLIRRGYGIYRKAGDRFYATFRVARDFSAFARNRLSFDLGNLEAPFEDHNVISGTIGANGRELTVDQLMPNAGVCRLR